MVTDMLVAEDLLLGLTDNDRLVFLGRKGCGDQAPMRLRRPPS
jgi:hypothetical protein